MSLIAGGAFGGRAVPKQKRKLFLSTKISPKDAEASSEKAELLMALSLIGGYYFVGVVAYTYNLERDNWNVRDSLYFATVTMTTVGYGDMVPSSFASRHFTTAYVLFGVCLAAVAFRQVLDYITKQRDALLAATKRKLLVDASANTAKMVTEQSDEALHIFNKRRPSLIVQAARRLSSLRISGGSNGSGGNLNGSLDAVTNANSVNWNHHIDAGDESGQEEKCNIRRRRKSGTAGSRKHENGDENKDNEAASSDNDYDDDEERGSTFDAGSSMDLSRPPHRRKKQKEKEGKSIYCCCPAFVTFCWQYCCCGCRYCYSITAWALAFIHRLLELFPILKVVGTLALYVLVTGLVYGHLEGLTVVDSVYFAVITGTTVGYGDVSPTSSNGRWLALIWLPVSIISVGGELSRVGECLFGDVQSDKLNELMNMDLSLEALMAIDEDGDMSISEFEFLRFMLSSADIVDAEALDSLHKRFQALDVDGSGSLSRADIVDLVESENSGGNEEPLTDLSSSSPSSELAAAKRSAVVEARLALSEAMAFASDSTKEFAVAKARELHQQHRNKPPPSYDELLAKAGASGPKPRRKQPQDLSSSGDKKDNNSNDTKTSSTGKGTPTKSPTSKVSTKNKKLGSPRAHDRYLGFNDDVSGGVVGGSSSSNSNNDDVASSTSVSPLVPNGLASPVDKPSTKKALSSSSSSSGTGLGWRSRWLTFGKEVDGTSDGGDSSSDNETQL